MEEDLLAIALKYERNKDDAPKVTAKGKGEIAKQIIKIANEEGVSLKEDKQLAQILAFLEIDDLIPIEAYGTVAEILNYIYQQNDKEGNKNNE